MKKKGGNKIDKWICKGRGWFARAGADVHTQAIIFAQMGQRLRAWRCGVRIGAVRIVFRLWSMMAYAAFETCFSFFLSSDWRPSIYLKKGARGRGGKRLYMSVEKKEKTIDGSKLGWREGVERGDMAYIYKQMFQFLGPWLNFTPSSTCLYIHTYIVGM